MRPAIVYRDDTPGEAFLVDTHSVFLARHPEDQTKLCPYAATAVTIWDLKAGQGKAKLQVDVRTNDPSDFVIRNSKIEFPMPCSYLALMEHKMVSPLARGIYLDAAVALLKLAQLKRPFSIQSGGSLKIGAPAKGWNRWCFIAAWHWSFWQTEHNDSRLPNWTMTSRWKNLANLGYPHEEPAFRKMCSNMGLLLRKSKSTTPPR